MVVTHVTNPKSVHPIRVGDILRKVDAISVEHTKLKEVTHILKYRTKLTFQRNIANANANANANTAATVLRTTTTTAAVAAVAARTKKRTSEPSLDTNHSKKKPRNTIQHSIKNNHSPHLEDGNSNRWHI